jgi:hypothetical protein
VGELSELDIRRLKERLGTLGEMADRATAYFDIIYTNLKEAQNLVVQISEYCAWALDRINKD